MLNVDTSVKIKDGWNKYILRKSITEMPDKIRWRRDKKGFTVPEKAWIQGELRTEFMKEFKTSKLAEMGIIQTSELIQAYNQFIEGKSTIPYAEFIRLFIAEKWAKMHFS
jgi:asparagine synthase (glutamine-hydrolysing)